MRLRSYIFWPHLIAGVSAGAVILLMCVTGVLLTYERQLIAWSDSRFQSAKPTPDAKAPSVVGEASRSGVRQFMSNIRAWHRWLAVDGDRRPIARAITGWSNLLFLFIVASGIYLWFPRKWTWRQLRNVVWFNRAARGKARDFNWHNVIGSWCAVPLFIIVLCAMPISFPWFNAFVYRAVGEAPPTPGRPTAARPAERRDASVTLGAIWARSDLTLGRRVRTTMRFAHTGEVLGVAGQTIAGIASVGGAVLVWTGLALAWRRFRAWAGRRQRVAGSSRVSNAA